MNTTLLTLGNNRSGLSDRVLALRLHDAVKEVNRLAVQAGDEGGLLITFDVAYGSHGPASWPVIHHTVSRPLIRYGVEEGRV